ncbi:MAG: dockerin type I domain-containing protein, partial [Pirellulaceae bacterium]|nr:dockerin type I domain-containing protein [Pirellulaceae bacterium]
MSLTKRRLAFSFARSSFRFGKKLLQFISKWSLAERKRLNSRLSRLEQLEARQVFAAAVWTNVLQPLDVNGDANSEISPLDALLVINELNNRVYAPQFQRLPLEVDDALKTNFVDVTCDGLVSPIDALLVINRLNARSNGVTDKPLPGSPTWKFTETGGSASAKGKYQFNACLPRLVEGDSYSSQLATTIKLYDSNSAVRVQFSAPVFDVASQNAIRDAVELLILDEAGQPLSLPFDFKRDASFNWTEGFGAVAGVGTLTTLQSPELVSTATFNLNGIPAGTNVQVVVRLLNNDSDKTSHITLRKLDVVPATELAPTGMRVSSAASPAPLPKPDPALLVDVSSSVVATYGRTAMHSGNTVLSTEIQLQNQGTSAISGRMLVVVDNLSELDVSVLNPDGYLEGRPYFVLRSNTSDWLSSGQSTDKRELHFKNQSGKQFTYSLTVLAELNHAPGGFTSTPLTEIEAGKSYRTTALANDPDNQPLVYTIAVGPQAATINPTTGEIN